MVQSSVYLLSLFLQLHTAQSAAVKRTPEAPQSTEPMQRPRTDTASSSNGRTRPTLRVHTSTTMRSEKGLERPYRAGFQCRRVRRCAVTPITPSPTSAACLGLRPSCFGGLSPTIASAYRAARTPATSRTSTPSTRRAVVGSGWLTTRSTSQAPVSSAPMSEQRSSQTAPDLLGLLAEVGSSIGDAIGSTSMATPPSSRPAVPTTTNALDILNAALSHSVIKTSDIRGVVKSLADGFESTASAAVTPTTSSTDPPVHSEIFAQAATTELEASTQPITPTTSSARVPENILISTTKSRALPSSTATSYLSNISPSLTSSNIRATLTPEAVPLPSPESSTSQTEQQVQQQQQQPGAQDHYTQSYAKTVGIAVGVTVPGASLILLAGALFYYRRNHGALPESWGLRNLRSSSHSHAKQGEDPSSSSTPQSSSAAASGAATLSPQLGTQHGRGAPTIPRSSTRFPVLPQAAHFARLAPLKRHTHKRQTSSLTSLYPDSRRQRSKDSSSISPSLTDDGHRFTSGDVSGFDFHCGGSATHSTTVPTLPRGPLSPVSPVGGRVQWWDEVPAMPKAPVAAAVSRLNRSSQRPRSQRRSSTLLGVIGANYELEKLARAESHDSNPARGSTHEVIGEGEERETVYAADVAAAAVEDENPAVDGHKSPQELLLGKMWAPVSPKVWW